LQEAIRVKDMLIVSVLAIAPIFEQLATSHSQPGKLAFAKVDVDAHQDITQQYGVSAYVVTHDFNTKNS
jgi:hypothetical protein